MEITRASFLGEDVLRGQPPGPDSCERGCSQGTSHQLLLSHPLKSRNPQGAHWPIGRGSQLGKKTSVVHVPYSPSVSFGAACETPGALAAMCVSAAHCVFHWIVSLPSTLVLRRGHSLKNFNTELPCVHKFTPGSVS